MSKPKPAIVPAAPEPRPFQRPPRADAAGRPITFKGADSERLAYEHQALEDGFIKRDGSPDLSAWIRDCLEERMQLGRRKR